MDYDYDYDYDYDFYGMVMEYIHYNDFLHDNSGEFFHTRFAQVHEGHEEEKD